MRAYEPDQVATTLIATEGCYLAIFDRLSPANTPGKWWKAMDWAHERVGEETWAALWAFDGYWQDRAAAGELLAWILLFDGVFRIQLEVVSDLDQVVILEDQKATVLTSNEAERILDCPSGEITVDSLARLGAMDLRPLVVVPPGRYLVRLAENRDAVNDHSFLERLDEYPEGEGPDWMLYLERQRED